MNPLDLFLFCGQGALANASSAQVAEGARAYLEALEAGEWLDAQPCSVPVVSELLDGDFGAAMDGLCWVPSPRGDDADAQEIALCPINNHVDLGSVTAGLLLAGAGRVYPEHNHPPQELYYVLSGTASWRYGGSDQYELVRPKQTFYNPPGVTHSARAATHEPVLAFYALWP